MPTQQHQSYAAAQRPHDDPFSARRRRMADGSQPTPTLRIRQRSRAVAGRESRRTRGDQHALRRRAQQHVAGALHVRCRRSGSWFRMRATAISIASPATRSKPGTSLRQILEYRREQGTDFSGIVPGNLSDPARARGQGGPRTLRRARGRDYPPDDVDRRMADHARGHHRAGPQRAAHRLSWRSTICSPASPTARMFSERLDDAAKRLARHGTTFTVLMLDLDKFKNVNDTLGHPAGDQLAGRGRAAPEVVASRYRRGGPPGRR